MSSRLEQLLKEWDGFIEQGLPYAAESRAAMIAKEMVDGFEWPRSIFPGVRRHFEQWCFDRSIRLPERPQGDDSDTRARRYRIYLDASKTMHKRVRERVKSCRASLEVERGAQDIPQAILELDRIDRVIENHDRDIEGLLIDDDDRQLELFKGGSSNG